MLEPAIDATRLRRHGLRATAPRLAVLAMLARAGGHRSADELVVELRRAGYPHARTTVYNALQDLTRVGLIREAPVAAGALRYEADTSPHDHFVCRGCGQIRNVTVHSMTEAPPELASVVVESLDLVHRGWCERCAEARDGGGPHARTDPAEGADGPRRRPGAGPDTPGDAPPGADAGAEG
jgi:Fe2+ or Zn2+ uptake regulation protein